MAAGSSGAGAAGTARALTLAGLPRPSGFPSPMDACLGSLLFSFNFLYFRAGIYLGWRRGRIKTPVLLSR